MSQVEVGFWRDSHGRIPVREFVLALKSRDARAAASCVDLLRMLEEHGNALRRPHADYLREGIYELRLNQHRVQFRLLYFFDGRARAVVTSAFAKTGKVPEQEIQRALNRRQLYLTAPDRYAYLGPEAWRNL